MLGLPRDAARWWRKHKQREARSALPGRRSARWWDRFHASPVWDKPKPARCCCCCRRRSVGHEEHGGTRARDVAIISVTPVNRMTLDEWWRNPMQKARWRRTPSPAREFPEAYYGEDPLLNFNEASVAIGRSAGDVRESSLIFIRQTFCLGRLQQQQLSKSWITSRMHAFLLL